MNVEMSQDKDAFVRAGRGSVIEVHRFDDVDSRLDQEHAMRGQKRVSSAGWEALERDRVCACQRYLVFGQPLRPRFAHSGHPGTYTPIRGIVGEVFPPPASDQHRVAGPNRRGLSDDRRFKVGRGDLVPGFADFDTQHGRNVEKHTTADKRREFVDAQHLEPSGRLRLGGRYTTE